MNLAHLDALVDRTAGPDACWPWTGGRTTKGYGRASLSGRPVLIHRLICELTHGPLAPGHVARHTCDNPPCANPRHIIPGTHKDNAADKIARGRDRAPGWQPGGQDCPRSKLTWEDVRAIRAAYTGRRGQLRELAEQYGVTRPNIGYIVRGTTWR